MKAVLYHDGALTVGDYAEPVPESGQALVRTLACGICGSDLHFRHHACAFVEMAARAGSSFTMDLAKPVVMGHEFCGELLDHGPGTAARFKPGTTVTSVPAAAVNGIWQTVGQSSELPGGFGERMVLTEAMLLEVPNGLSPVHAALTEPMAVGWHAASLAQLPESAIPVVVGCGPVGLAVIAALRAQGVREIVASDFSPGRRALARAMGATHVVDPAEHGPFESWHALVAARHPDAAAVGAKRDCTLFECVGVPGMIRQLMNQAPSGSNVIVVGACMEPDTIEPMMGIFKALKLQFSLAYSGEEYARALRAIAEGEIDVAPLVTGQVGLDEVPDAFAALERPGHHAKIIVEPWR